MSALDDKIAALAARFAARAADEHSALSDALARDDRDLIVERAHKLAGSAGMFGHADIGEAALVLEEAARNGDDVAGPGAAMLALLDRL